MAPGKLNQFCLLIWKNWIIQKRKRCCTIFEIIVPLLLSILIALIRLSIHNEVFDNVKVWDRGFELGGNLYDRFDFINLKASISFAPTSTTTQSIMSQIATEYDIELEGEISFMINEFLKCIKILFFQVLNLKKNFS